MQAPKPLTKPTKQRKMIYNAPAHIRHKLLAAHLSQGLRASHDVRSLAVRTGDTVRVVRGDHRGVEGKITRVDLAKYRIYVEGLTREKVDGTTVFVPVHPSKVIITHLSLDDEWRKKVLETKRERHEKPEKALEKPEEVAEAKEVVEEKPVYGKKPPVERVKRAKRKAPAKKAAERAEPRAEETKKVEKPKAKRRTRRSTRKVAKKTEQEGN